MSEVTAKVGRVFSLCLILHFVIFAVSCKTPPKPYQPLNYSDAMIREIEIADIQSHFTDKPLESLWRADLLRKNATEDKNAVALFSRAEEYVFDLFETAVAKKDWVVANTLFNSLQACDSELAAKQSWTSKSLKREMESKNSYGLPTVDSNVKVSQMINGTVTVWVDLGIKIQSGVGYADRVIGSGFFIDTDGYLVTNYHVISSQVDPKYAGYSRLYVKLAQDSETRIPAKVIGWDKMLDLALLKVELTPSYVFALGSSSDLEVGDPIYAIGSPVGLEKTLTSGVVSAVDRKLFPMGQVMQIDAAINSGNSGGPIIDKNGAVQAIVFAGISSYEGLSFAIPIEYLKNELSRLYAGGAVDHGWIGAYGKTKKIPGGVPGGTNGGLEILYLMPGSAAVRSGLVPGSVISSIDGDDVSCIEEFQNLLLTKAPNSIVKIGVLDENSTGKEVYYSVFLETRPDQPGYEVYKHDKQVNYLLPILGMQLVNASESDKKLFYISSVVKGSIADESGFSIQDPVQVQRTQVSPDKTMITVDFMTKKRKGGYLDVYVSVPAPLDSSDYF